MLKIRSIYSHIFTSLIFMFLGVFNFAAHADDFVEIDYASAKLIVGEPIDTHKIQAVVEVALANKFKTYWFMPGDGGIPPYFATRQGDVEIHLPKPSRIDDQYGSAVGYKNALSIPLTITLEEEVKNIDQLSLDMTIGVCADICIPFIARLSGPIPTKRDLPPRKKFKLDDAFAALSSPFTENFYAKNIVLSKGKQENTLELNFQAIVPTDSILDDFDAFAAILGDGNFFSLKPRVEPKDRQLNVTMPVTSAMNPDHFSNKKLRLLLVSGEDSVEQTIILP